MEGLQLDLSKVIGKAIDEKLDALNLEKRIDEILKITVEGASKQIKLITPEGIKECGVQHKQFEKILKIVNAGLNLMVKGEAGNGKSHVIAEVAKALDIPFHSMSVSNQTTKTDLLGFVDANGVYRYNGFISAFRDGGIFNMDEIDAGNPNILVVLNSALSNGFIEAPNGEMLYKHKDFRFCCTANTVGRGANQKYVGRNKLDMATLDRFNVIDFELDEDIELMLIDGDKILHNAIKNIRKYASENYEDLYISQRSAVSIKALLDMEFDIDEALDIAVLKGVSEDICNGVKTEFKKHFSEPKRVEKYEGEVEVLKDEVKVEFDEATDETDFEW